MPNLHFSKTKIQNRFSIKLFRSFLQNGKFVQILLLPFLVLFAGFGSWVSVAQVLAADGINKTINFQGKLVNSSGLNVADDTYSVVFTLYDADSGGSNLWDETQNVTTTDGIFHVTLGSVDTTLGNVNFNSDSLYLGIKVGADSEMTPRIRMSAVPYAFNATKVNGLTVTNTSDNPFSSTTVLKLPDGMTYTIASPQSGTSDTIGTLTSTSTFTNKTIGSTGLTFSGAGTDITTVSNEDFTFDINGSGDLVINSDFQSGVSIGSSSNTPAVLSVSGGIGNNAAFIVNNNNAGDLFVASQAGTTKFRIANNGDLVLTAGLYAGGSLGDSSMCLTGGASIAWASCGTGTGTNYWQVTNGAVSPFSNTLDFLVGSTASSSAVFKVSPNTNSVTASVSANSIQSALVVDNRGLGDLFSASSSGRSRFTIQQNGTIVLGADGNIQTDVTIRGGISTGSNVAGANITFDGSRGTGTANSGDFIFRTGTSGSNGSAGWCNDTSGVSCDGNWSTRKKITFNNSASNEDLNNFPALIKIDSSDITYSKTQSDGGDIRFVDPDNPNEVLPHEIESWNDGGTSYVWVKVPTIDANSTSDYIWMYYGNASASDGQEPTSVWDSNYKAVWHMKEDPSSGAPQILDSTSNNNDGSSGGSMTSGDQVSAQVNGGLDFDNSDDRYSATDHASLRPQALTLSMWVFPRTLPGTNGVQDTAIAKKRSGDLDSYHFGLDGPTGRQRFCLEPSGGAICLTTGTTSTSQWSYITATWDGTTMRTYKNGVQNGTTATQTNTLDYTADPVYVGAQDQNGTIAEFFDGVLDEGRVSDTNRSGDWIEAEYLTMTDAMNSFGSEETGAGFSERFRITSSGTFGLNTNSPTATFDVRAQSGGLPFASFTGQTDTAALVLNNIGTGDLFTASKSGTTKFVIKNSGIIAVDSTNYANCSILSTDADGLIGCASAGGSDMMSSASYGGTSDVAGTNIPLNIVMSIATASATPTSDHADVYVRGYVNLVSGSNNDQAITLSLRKNTCSGTVLSSDTTNITVSANTPSHVIELSGVDTNPGTSTTNYVLCESATGATSIAGKRGMFTQVVDPVGPAGESGVGVGADYLRLENGSFSTVNDTADFLIGGVATNSAKFAVTNMTGSGTPTASVSATSTGNGITLGGDGVIQALRNNNLILGGNTTGSVQLADTLNASNNQITNVDVLSISDPGAGEGISFNSTNAAWKIDVSNLSRADGDGNLNLYGTSDNIALWRPSLWVYDATNYTTGTALSNGGMDFTTTGTGNLGLNPGGNVGIGLSGSNSLLAKLDIRGTSGTIAVASVSGNTSLAAMFVDNNGVGDLFTASKSGATKFTVLNSGDLQFANYTTAGGLLYTNSTGTVLQTTAGNSGECLKSAAGSAPTWGTCGGGSSTWNITDGAISPVYASTLDLLVGGISSSSAKFAVLNIGNGTPTASVSAPSTGNALAIDANGNITTSKKRTLTLGGGDSGEVYSASTFRLDATNGIKGGGLSDCSSPTTSKLLWDASTNRFSCGTDQGGLSEGTLTVRESDSSPSVAGVALLEFGPASTSTDEFIVSDEGSNTARVRIGNQVAMLNQAESVTGGWTFNTAATTFTTGIIANGGLNTTTNTDLSLAANGSGHIRFSVDADTGVLIGSNATTAPLSVSGGIGSNALAIFNQTNNGDILAASAAGTTKFVIKNDGTASSSAGFTIDGAGNIQTTRGQTLTIGGNRTGNLVFQPNQTANSLTMAAGASTIDISTNGSTGLTLDSGTTGSITIGNNANAKSLTIGNTTGATGLTFNTGTNGINFGDNANTKTIDIGGVDANGVDTIRIGTNATSADAITIGNNHASTTLTLTGGSLWSIDATGAAKFSRTFGSGLSTCNGSTQKLLWNGGSFSCGTDQTGGGGATVKSGTRAVAEGTPQTVTFTTPFSSTPYCAVTVDLSGSGAAIGGRAHLTAAPTTTQISIDWDDSAGGGAKTENLNWICTDGGNADLAEMYASNDTTIEPGDVVSLDSGLVAGVRKSTKSYQTELLGVVSTQPAMTIGSVINGEGSWMAAVALAGRVPVKVSTENGVIHAGDYLTSSSIPGVAMKATKAGPVVGIAMGDFGSDEVGSVLMFVKGGYFMGASMVDTEDSIEPVPSSQSLQATTLTKLIEHKASLANAAVLSEITTDRVTAGLEVIAPSVIADELQVNTIKAATGNDISILLDDNGNFVIKNTSGSAVVTFDTEGNAFFAGDVHSDGLALLEDTVAQQESRLTNLETLFASVSSSSATVTPTPAASMAALVSNLPELNDIQDTDKRASESDKLTLDSLRVTGSALIEGMLHVVDFMTVRNLIVDQLATFLGKVVFSGDVFFEGSPTFNNDTAGIAVIKKGNKSVEVQFEKEYESAPMVNVNLTLDEVSPMPSEELESLMKRQEAQEARLFKADVRYVITKRTAKGFVILLDKKAEEDVAFSWIAVRVDKSRLDQDKPVVQKGNGDKSKKVETYFEENGRPISSDTLNIIPTSSIEKREEETLLSPEEEVQHDPPTPSGLRRGEEGGE